MTDAQTRPDRSLDSGHTSTDTPLWFNRSFTLMWASVAASGFGDRIITSAAMVLLGAFALDSGDNRVSVIAAVNFWFFLPYLLWSPIAGWLADHLPRKWLLFACDEGRALLLLATFYLLIDVTGDPVLKDELHWKVYGILFAIGVLAATFNPARNATVPQIVGGGQLQAANAMIIGLGVVASMVGAVAAGKIIDADQGETVKTGFLIACAFYAVSGTFFAFLKVRKSHSDITPRSNRSMVQGLRYLRDHRRQMSLMIAFTLVWAAAMVVYNGALTLGDKHFGLEGDPLFVHFTIMSAIIGGGMLTGGIVIGLIGTQKESTIVLGLAMVFAAISIAIFTLVPWKPAHYVSGFLVGVFGNVAIINVLSLIQAICPNYVRGRIMGLTNIVSTTGNVAVNYAIWKTPNADTWMPGTLMFTATALAIVGSWTLFQHMRRGPLHSPVLNGVWRVVRLFTYVLHRLEVKGVHNVPRTGPVILIANHTTALDPWILQAPYPRVIRWVMYSSYRFKIFEFAWKRMEPVFLEDGGRQTAQLRQMIAALKEDAILGFFPEGSLQRTHRRIKPFQPGIGLLAKRSGAPIVIAWISDTPRAESMLVHFLRPTRSRIDFAPPWTPDPTLDAAGVVAELRRRLLEQGARVALEKADGACPACEAELGDLKPVDTGEIIACPNCGHLIFEGGDDQSAIAANSSAANAPVNPSPDAAPPTAE